MPSNYCSMNNALACGVPTQIKLAAGETYDLTWRTPRQCTGGGGTPPGFPGGTTSCTVTYRLADVRGNSGYAMKIKYGSNTDSLSGSLPPPDWFRRTGLKFLDLSQVTCSPSATNCDAVAGNWPTVSYSETYSAPSQILTIDNSQTGTWRIARNTSNGEVRIRRPGAVSDTTIATRDPSTGKVVAVTDDGATQSYNWTSLSGNPAVIATDGTGRTSAVERDPGTARPGAVSDGLNRTTK